MTVTESSTQLAETPTALTMRQRVEAFDWSKTAIGPRDKWPQSLKTAVDITLHSPVAIVMLWGPDGIMIYNDAYSIFAGARHPFLLGSKVVEGWPEVADFNRHVMEIGLKGQTLSYTDQQLTLYRNNVPEAVHMNLDYSPIIDESGKPAGVFAIVTDITQQVQALADLKQAEALLKVERTRLHRLFMDAPAMIAVMSGPDHIFELANPLYVQLVGNRPLVGRAFREALPEIEGQGIYEILDEVYASGKPFFAHELPVSIDRNAQGDIRLGYFNFVYQPSYDASNQVDGILLHAVEVTESVEARQKVAESEELFRTLADQSPIVVFMMNGAGAATYWNKHWLDLTGLTLEQALDMPLKEVIHPDDYEPLLKVYLPAVAKRENYTFEVRIRRHDGQYRTYLFTAGPRYLTNNEFAGYVGMGVDITRQKELERQKDDFLGIASHELKTPVTSIKAYGQVLERTFRRSGDLKSAQQLEKMGTQVNRLTSLIDDLLDVTKIQSGRIMFHEESFDFNELVEQIAGDIQMASEKHTFVMQLGPTATIRGDRDRIGQVISNLIVNAVKYSPHADKVIIASAVNDQMIMMSVQDFGVGISPEKQEKVFQQFFRVSGPKEDTFPGLGLGLYISSEIIKRQSGKIWVESKIGKGSKFCFSLPLNHDHDPNQVSSEHPTLKGNK